MKIRSSIFWFIIVVAALIAFLLWLREKKPTTNVPTAAMNTNVTEQIVVTNATVGANASTTVAPKSEFLSKPSLESKGQQMLEILSTYNDVPINFFGRVEDQFGNAITDATINFNIRIMNGQESTVERGQVMSDDNGFFAITGYRGQDLGLAPQKSGYVISTTETLFKYSHMEGHPYVSDRNNPTVIKMWKLQGSEPLVAIDQHYKIPYTSSPIIFDLLTGKIVPVGGDVKLIVNRPAGIVSGSDEQDWGLQVEAVDGGLVDAVNLDPITYVAPENGYQSNETFTMSTNDNTWYGAARETFFVKSRNGQIYSKLNLYVRINQNPDDPLIINLNGVANTNSSRNFEATAQQQ